MLSETRWISPWLPTEFDQVCQMKDTRLSVERRDQEPNWLLFNSPLHLRIECRCLEMAVSSTFEIKGMRRSGKRIFGPVGWPF